MKGKIVLVPFPFTDLTAAKLRPALVIYEGQKDAVVAFISSKIPSELSEVDILIIKGHPGFRRTGLKADSVIRLDKIATFLKDLVLGELGKLDEELTKEVNQKLKRIMEIQNSLYKPDQPERPNDFELSAFNFELIIDPTT